MMKLYYKYYPNKFSLIGNIKPSRNSIEKINSHKFKVYEQNKNTIINPFFTYENIICKICGIKARIREGDNYVSFNFVEGHWITVKIISCEEEIMERACK